MKLAIHPIVMWSNNTKLFCYAVWSIKRSIRPAFFLLLYSFLYSQDAHCINNSKNSSNTVVYDSAKIDVRTPTTTQQKELLSDNDYKYDRVGPAPKTPWERFKDWFWRKVGELFNSKGGSIGLRILGYVLIITAIVMIVVLLSRNNIRALFFSRSDTIPIDYNEFEEDIHKINFDELIAAALSEKDFRRAVRLHFLKLLKELADKNLILWKIDKTNNDYSIELSDSKYSKHFKELAVLYEYIWYGNFELDETNFKTTIEKFKQFEI